MILRSFLLFTIFLGTIVLAVVVAHRTVRAQTLSATIVISGTFKEYDGGSCTEGIEADTVEIDIIPDVPTGFEDSCETSVDPTTGRFSSYLCQIDFGINSELRQDVTFSITSGDDNNPRVGSYVSSYLIEAEECPASGGQVFFIDLSPGDSNIRYTQDIAFSRSAPWTKIRNASFVSNSPLVQILPETVEPYDETDIDSTNGYRVFSSGTDSGVVAVPEFTVPSSEISSQSLFTKSVDTYAFDRSISRSLYFDYVQAKRRHTTITELSQISEKGIYVLDLGEEEEEQSEGDEEEVDKESDVVISSITQPINWLAAPDLVLFVPGFLSFDAIDFNPSSSFVFIADEIEFTERMRFAKGIFMARKISVDFREPIDDEGLKIQGNIIATESFTNARIRESATKPSVFVAFDPSLYMDLLPIFSAVEYEWKEE